LLNRIENSYCIITTIQKINNRKKSIAIIYWIIVIKYANLIYVVNIHSIAIVKKLTTTS